MKKLLLLCSIGISLFASELVVKKDIVKLSINADTVSLEKNEKLKLIPGSTICFLDGNGKVIIDKRKQLSKKSKKCYTTKIPKGFDINKFMTNLKQKAEVALISGELKVKNGVSTRSIFTSEVVESTSLISKDNDKVVIYDTSYGPLPVTLNIYDEKGKLEKIIVNEDNDVTFFIVSTKKFKTGYKLVVTNAFEDELLIQNIKK